MVSNRIKLLQNICYKNWHQVCSNVVPILEANIGTQYWSFIEINVLHKIRFQSCPDDWSTIFIKYLTNNGKQCLKPILDLYWEPGFAQHCKNLNVQCRLLIFLLLETILNIIWKPMLF